MGNNKNKKKKIVIGITGGIAVYKICQLVSNLSKKDYTIDIIMTKNATKFVGPHTFSTLIKNPIYLDTFEEFDYSVVNHINLARTADLFLIAPATANIIGKIANGIADDMLTSTVIAVNNTCPILICPSMNTHMYENKITQRNIQQLKELDYKFIEPGVGLLACGDIGKGKLADIELIEEAIEYYLNKDKPLLNKNVLITAGPTIEKMDPVRFISNHSSGKMGYALAKVARNLGAHVTLVSGPTNLNPPFDVAVLPIESAKDMDQAVKENYLNQDIIIKAAAVADYTFKDYSENKMKKQNDTLLLSLEKTKDILAFLGKNKKNHQILCGFAMETENLIENAQKKLINKNCDLLIANSINEEGSGFKVDTNKITIIKKDTIKSLPIQSKENVALEILNEIISITKEKR